jgi:hypothetical protein
MSSDNGFDAHLKCLTGNRAGLIYNAHSIGAADSLEQSLRWNRDKPPEGFAQAAEVQNCWAVNKCDGFWIEGVGRVVVGSDWENLFTPFDTTGKEICIGDTIAYARRDLTVSLLKIDKIAPPKGSYERTLYGIDLHTNKRTKNSYPTRCLKISP